MAITTAETTEDAVLGGRLTLRQPVRGHRVGHDALLLAALAPASCRAMVDLGAGVGSAGLAFLTRCPEARGTLVEIDPDLARLAAENAEANGLAARCQVVAADVLTLGRPGGAPEPVAHAADLVLMNPPFNPAAAHQVSPHPGRAQAHMAGEDLLEAWVKAAHRCLNADGVLCLIHRPEEAGAILAALQGRFGAAELLPVYGRPGGKPGAAAVRLLVRARKGRRTAPRILPGLVLTDAAGAPTPEAAAVLRAGDALAPP
ncbi:MULTISPECIES: tRNA1(Val) (adenine(37)-N6)-methyltransferase [unclassified Xanthobacter]|uniref:tRNA1(Val) (adenine(37)-N6)-methyltransferase n=1 Tax=unclassified Xanthobacter TaxID=2623496 RepID=UPI001EDD1C33|nr:MULTISPECIES: methyltransferase [unclassified Xanthobacter]